MTGTNFEMVRITELRVGETVEHDGTIVTVNKGDFKYNPFMGLSFRGDSYHLNTKKIKRFI